MDWKGRRRSTNVEDRRSMPAKGILGGGVGTIVIVLIVMLLGGNPADVLQSIQPADSQVQATYVESAEEKELYEFASVVLAETETVWAELFKQEGASYTYPKLVIYKGSVQSACGTAGASVGPFYCPGDQSVYLDLSFYNELKNKFNAPGDFAMAYVIAHEVGHHVQNLMGITDQVFELKARLSETEYNELTVRMELQADYFSGVWAYYAADKNLLEKGDLEEALNAASAVGDDTLQKKYQGYIVPDSFTHGTSEQRRNWFYKGFESGSLAGGDTFSAETL